MLPRGYERFVVAELYPARTSIVGTGRPQNLLK